MSITTCLVLDGDRSFAEVCAPLASDLDDCFWAIDRDFQINNNWYNETDDADAIIASVRWELPALVVRFAGFRPGFVPVLADRLYIDEQSFFFAIEGPEPRAEVRATRLEEYAGVYAEAFLRDLGAYADLLLWHIDGWWEFYCSEKRWYDRLRSAWPDALERPLGDPGVPPPRGRPAFYEAADVKPSSENPS